MEPRNELINEEIINQMKKGDFEFLKYVKDSEGKVVVRELYSLFYEIYQNSILINFTKKSPITIKNYDHYIKNFINIYGTLNVYLKDELFFLYFHMTNENNPIKNIHEIHFRNMKYFIDKKYFKFLMDQNKDLFFKSLFLIVKEINLNYAEDRKILEILSKNVEDAFFKSICRVLLGNNLFDDSLLLSKKNLSYFSELGEKVNIILEVVDDETKRIASKAIGINGKESSEHLRESNIQRIINNYKSEEYIDKLAQELLENYNILKEETSFKSDIFDIIFPKDVKDMVRVITLCAHKTKDVEFQLFLEEILETYYFTDIIESIEKFNQFLNTGLILSEYDLLINHFLLTNANVFKFTFPSLYSKMNDEFKLHFENLNLFIIKSKHFLNVKYKFFDLLKKEISGKFFLNGNDLSYEFKYVLENITFKIEFKYENITELIDLDLSIEEYLIELTNEKSFYYNYLRNVNEPITIKESKKEIKKFTSTFGSPKSVMLLKQMVKKSNKITSIVEQWKELVDKFMESINECGICYFKELNDKASSMNCKRCNMFYHKDCFYQWVKKTKKIECAMCKYDIVE
ncbi:hypothetical protein H312_01995 [Anncaliia algerae PRA339]|uniref:RING-type domain-containing protein n=1 Tax=Anncaliia algerae PRA339 TaxID=1288291 RepID=A0A059F0E5_9MICR|nr:hypothetical protein H312_01995 [Anncaliia algerae PRA339]